MKKYFIYSFVALIGIISTVSCVQPLDAELRNTTGAPQLILSVSCQEPSTKAYEGYPAGENDYNENTIKHVDWFIFRDTTGTAWKSGRVSNINNPDGSTGVPVTTMDMRQFIGTASSATGYVFTVANYPGTEGHSLFEGKTFAQIREMSYVTSELDAMISGQFSPLSSFVMTSDVQKFTLTEASPSATINAKLSRQIAKISLNITVVPFIDEMKARISGLDTTRVEYVQTWYPDVKGIRAYMTYANKRGSLYPVTNSTSLDSIPNYNDTDFFTYYNRCFTPVITYHDNNPRDTAYVSGPPFYSYPLKWETSDPHAPFIKIILAWKSVQEPIQTVSTSFLNHTTGGRIPGEKDSVLSYSFPDAAVGSQKFYYKIAIPSERNILRCNTWTKIKLDVSILGGMEDESSVEVAGRYYVVNWSDPGVAGGGDLTSGKYLSLATNRNTFYLYGVDTLQIPVKSSHQLAATIIRREACVNGVWTETPRKPNGSNINISSRGHVLIDDDGHSSISLVNKLNTSIGNSLDCYPLRFTINLRHAAGSGGLTTTETVYVYQYPPIFVDSKAGGNVFVDGYYGNVDGYYRYRGTRSGTGYPTSNTSSGNYPNGTVRTGQSPTAEATTGGTAYNVPTPYGRITLYAAQQQNLTVVSISAFPEGAATYSLGNKTEQYLIADPRQNSDFNTNSLIAYNNTSTNTNTSWGQNASKIKIGNTTTTNFIAPKFIIASRWSRLASTISDVDLSTARKRCATYQEAGYPAGRWRLPTEAEINFVINLQRYGFINELFLTRTYSASGSGLEFSNNAITYTPNVTNGAAVRCVYDAWYWGDEPVSGARSTYTIGVE